MADVKTPGPRPYGGQSAEARMAERRRTLLDAAFALVAERGWAALRIDALCAQAGLNKRYFYESFANLDAVAGTLMAELAQGSIAVTLAAVDDAAAAGPEAATRQMITAFVHHLTDDPRRARVLLGAIPPGEAAAGHRQAAMRQIVSAAAGAGRDLHAVPDAPAVRVAASVLVGGTSQAILDWLQETAPVDQAELIDLLVGIWQVVGAEAVTRSRQSDGR